MGLQTLIESCLIEIVIDHNTLTATFYKNIIILYYTKWVHVKCHKLFSYNLLKAKRNSVSIFKAACVSILTTIIYKIYRKCLNKCYLFPKEIPNNIIMLKNIV